MQLLDAVRRGENRTSWQLSIGGLDFWQWLEQPGREEDQATFNRQGCEGVAPEFPGPA